MEIIVLIVLLCSFVSFVVYVEIPVQIGIVLVYWDLVKYIYIYYETKLELGRLAAQFQDGGEEDITGAEDSSTDIPKDPPVLVRGEAYCNEGSSDDVQKKVQ